MSYRLAAIQLVVGAYPCRRDSTARWYVTKNRNVLERDPIRRGGRVKRLLIVISTGEASSPGWEPAQQGGAQLEKPQAVRPNPSDQPDAWL